MSLPDATCLASPCHLAPSWGRPERRVSFSCLPWRAVSRAARYSARAAARSPWSCKAPAFSPVPGGATRNRKFAVSLPEGTGFEPSVPPFRSDAPAPTAGAVRRGLFAGASRILTSGPSPGLVPRARAQSTGIHVARFGTAAFVRAGPAVRFHLRFRQSRSPPFASFPSHPVTLRSHLPVNRGKP